jgi:hypothetical protein
MYGGLRDAYCSGPARYFAGVEEELVSHAAEC